MFPFSLKGAGLHTYPHSKVMTWVAIDRAVKAVEQFGLDGDLEHWKNLRESIH